MITFLGGVALFLFGMHVMGEAIGREAGGRMKSVLENLTANRFKGLLLGTAVTAVIQSSAATCVMVLGFVNSGIMSLSSSIPVIMGANIGTCATAWLLSLNSISGQSFILRLINPDCFVPVLAVVGAFITMFTKSDRKRDAALIMLGFAVLMQGMDVMSDAMSPLTGSERFAGLLTVFSNPFIGILIGFVITCITQSSSASIGILQAVSAVGAIRFNTALPILLGINIGAMVIVQLSAVGGNKDAHRAAAIALIYNIIGAVVVQAVWSGANVLFHPALGDYQMGYVSVAVAHTVYKILISVLLLPFSKQLIALSKVFFKDGPEDEKFSMLDDRFMSTPTIAVRLCTELTGEMAMMARDSIFQAMDMNQRGYDESTARAVSEAESMVDTYEDKLGTYMAKLSGRSMTLSDSSEMARLLHCISDFERISDHAVNICAVSREMYEKNIRFSDEAQSELLVMYDAVREILSMTTDAFLNNDVTLAKQVEPLEQVIDQLKNRMRDNHVRRLQGGSCTTLLGFVFTDLVTCFERVADHCSNVAICVIQISNSSLDTHGYVLDLKNSRDAEYQTLYAQYKQKYLVV